MRIEPTNVTFTVRRSLGFLLDFLTFFNVLTILQDYYTYLTQNIDAMGGRRQGATPALRPHLRTSICYSTPTYKIDIFNQNDIQAKKLKRHRRHQVPSS